MNNPPKIGRLDHALNSTTSAPTPASVPAAPPDAILPDGLPETLPLTSAVAPATSSSSPPSTEDRIKDEQTRLRKCILAMRTQIKNPVILDQFLCCLSPVTAVDGRMPFTPKRVITTQDKSMLLHNLIGHAILEWGRFARGEITGEPGFIDPNILKLEEIVASGTFVKEWGAYPKERNSAIYVLRHVSEEKKLHKDRQEAQEKALERKAHIRSEGLAE